MINKKREINKKGKRCIETGKVREAKYNKRYKQVSEVMTRSRYLEKERIAKTINGKEIKISVRLICDNIKKGQ